MRKLEKFIVLAIAILIVQLAGVFYDLLSLLDPRHWSPTAWMAITVTGLVVLVIVNAAPSLLDDWGRRRGRLAGDRHRQERQRMLKEQRTMIKQLREKRSRRIY